MTRKQESGASAPVRGLSGPKVPRHSGGWAALRKRLESETGLQRNGHRPIPPPANVHYLTRLGHSVFLADVVHDAWTGNWQTGMDEDGKPVWNVEGFLDQSLDFSGRKFDVVLLWTTLDYLPEPLVGPVVARLFKAMNPGGQVLAFFHTRTQGEETASLPLSPDRRRRRRDAVGPAVSHSARLQQPQHRAALCRLVLVPPVSGQGRVSELLITR